MLTVYSKLIFLLLLLSGFQQIFGQQEYPNDLIGIWEGPKIDGRNNQWDIFGPIEISRKADGSLTAKFLNSRHGGEDRILKKVSWQSGELKMQLTNWAGWLLEAKLSKQGTLTGHLNHHGMSEQFEFRKEVPRTTDQIINQYQTDQGAEHPPSQSQFFNLLLTRGIDKATSIFQKIRNRYPEHMLFGAGSMNSLGYDLLTKKQFDLAIGVFKLNAAAYPDDANCYDSLGEAYVLSGDREKAIRSLRKALSMNPADNVRQNSTKLLKQLGVSPEENGI